LASSVGLAEVGRRRAGGAAVFPGRCVVFAPAWLSERAICVWVAVMQRLGFGGVRYSGQRLSTAAHSTRSLRYQAATRGPLVTSGRAEAAAVGTVTERLQRRPAAATQRHDSAPGIDARPVNVSDVEVPAHDQGTIRVGRNGRRVSGIISARVAHDEPLPDFSPR
jgi:hypothetical protein